MQRNGIINTIINVQTWHWAEFPRNSDWPGLLNESGFWERLNKGDYRWGKFEKLLRNGSITTTWITLIQHSQYYHRYAIDTAYKKSTLGVSTF